jgi:hypothetical protein
VNLFVKFRDENYAESRQFDPGLTYPVYHIDVAEDEDGSTAATFLLANQAGDFQWIDMDSVKRASPPRQGGHRHSGRRDSRGADERGNRKDGDNPYMNSPRGMRDSILGNRDPSSLT